MLKIGRTKIIPSAIVLGVFWPLYIYAAEEETKIFQNQNPSHAPSVTPINQRFSIFAGDQAGGPVRYNTRFPTEAKDPNPTSYYRAQSFIGVGVEMASTQGAFLLEGLIRKDFSHHSPVERIDRLGDSDVEVKKFNFESRAMILGWVFGSLYQEASWKSSLGLVTEYSKLNIQTYNINQDLSVDSSYQMWSWSLRSRIEGQLVSNNLFDVYFGPELHLPIYSFKMKDEEANVPEDLFKVLDFKNSAAIGLGMSIGFRN